MFRPYVRSYNNVFSFTSIPLVLNSKSLPLYFHNTEHEIENRISTCPCLSEDLIGKCVKYLDQNPYARFFRYLRDVPVLDNYKIILQTIHGQDQRVSQVATIWINGEDNEDYGTRSIEVKTYNNESKSVQYYFGCYDPLHYPLMFPFGELGWHQVVFHIIVNYFLFLLQYWERNLITQSSFQLENIMLTN
uniref:Uncharacterized protein n=1 Tax=Lactuca sativa TaxID=4236 RepID=A0A9R1VM41_LACSA|nr:hypothetical protein LSAT_V11C500251610 [Lactuca sativa]